MAKPSTSAPREMKRSAAKPDGGAKRLKTGSGGHQAGGSRPGSDKPVAPATPMTRQERKEQQRERKARKHPNATLIEQATLLWEELRRHDVKPARRSELVAAILVKLQGKLAEVARSHTASRIVQACVKFGSPEQRAQVLGELRPSLQELAKSPHGHFVVMKLISTASKTQFKEFQKAFKGRVPELLRHPTAAQVVDELYGASTTEARHGMAAEFYAREYRVFEGGMLNGIKGAPTSLAALLDEVDAAKAGSVLQHLTTAVLPIAEKALVDSALVHRVLAEFMASAPASVVADVVSSLSGEPLLHMVHTQQGAATASAVFAHGTPRDRKMAVRALKGHVVDMAKDEWGHLPLITCLSVVDDTALLRKFVASELLKDLPALVQHQFGRRVILQLLRPDCNRYLSPAFQALAHPEPRIYTPPAAPSGHEHGADCGADCPSVPAEDGPASAPKKKEKSEDGDDDGPAPLQPGPLGVSKKDPELRRCEVLANGLGAALCTLCSEQAGLLLRQPNGAAVVMEVAAGGVPAAALGQDAELALERVHLALARLVAEPRAGEESEAGAAAGPAQEHVLESWHGSRALRWLALTAQEEGSDERRAAARTAASCLWREGLCGRCGDWVGTHGDKVLAAIWAALEGKERKDMQRELAPLLKGEAVPAWAAKFTAGKKKA